ncbi:unnamed protein product [Linum tenue]|uniref:Neprosin PEP catalytic domain-containing protein n=1 Tax=Linum tenue TaxID=586396 RepID=A0AAV0H9C9_9ROSI|nr:unnamed protein product [Linum tenue]
MNIGCTTYSSALIFVLLCSVLLLELNVITAQRLFRRSRKQLSRLDKSAVATIQLNSSLHGFEARATDSSSFGGEHLDIWLNGKGCPIGTVPIRKTTKNDLLRANLAVAVTSNLNPGVHVAVLRSTGDKRYHGAGMYTSVYNHEVQANQYTSSRFKLQNGPDSIAVGWVVNPSLYQDSYTRLFIYTMTKDVHCYNTYCPGFVVTNHEIPLDVILSPVSRRGGPTYEQNFVISKKDHYTGDWILRYGIHNKVLGFWPRDIFTGLAGFANYAEWGGEVYSPPGSVIPRMGSGCRPYGDAKLDGYARTIMVVDENEQDDYNPADCKIYQSDRVHYWAIDKGDVGGTWRRLIEFGGNSLLYNPNLPYAC